MNKIKVYLGHALNSAPKEFLEQMEDLKKLLRNHPRIHFMEYIGLDPNATDIQVFTHDETNVLECELFVAIATQDSTGLGVEIGIANNCHKPVLLCFSKTITRKSRMTTGSRVRSPAMKIVEYGSVGELFDQIVSCVCTMKK